MCSGVLDTCHKSACGGVDRFVSTPEMEVVISHYVCLQQEQLQTCSCCQECLTLVYM